MRVLVVDAEPRCQRLLEKCSAGRRSVKLIAAGNLAEARQRLQGQPIDLAVIESDLPDGSGLELAREIQRRRRRTQTILVGESPTVETTVEAMRAGAIDLFAKPVDFMQLEERVRSVMSRRDRERSQTDRIRRLRRACQKLDEARVEVSRQVDVLCTDLVSAYHELACQMHQAVSSTEYAALVRHELDLEQLLCTTLEYLVGRAGPTNAAMFLPANADEFSLGGYVNFDCSNDAADLLLDHLADVLAPRIAAHDKPLRLNDDESLARWVGDDAAYLAECDVVTFACRVQDETLAVVALFRDRNDPFDSSLVDICGSVGPIFGEALSRLIRIHHRHTLDSYRDEE